MEYSWAFVGSRNPKGLVLTSNLADSMQPGLLQNWGLRAPQQRAGMGGNDMDPSQLIVYAILWTFVSL